MAEVSANFDGLFPVASINLSQRELAIHSFGFPHKLRLGSFIQQSLENLTRKKEGR